MTTWAYLAKFFGYRTSPNFQLSLNSGAVVTISWESEEPEGTKIKMMTSVSFDGGTSWTEWKEVHNNGFIPDINTDDFLNDFVFRYRTFEETDEKNKTPVLKNVSFHFEPVIEINNNGDESIFPEVWITKVGNGDITIINTSDGNRETKFTDLIDGETVYINGERQQIETDLALTYRYSNFNDNYLEFIYGKNILKVIGDAKIQFRYQFKLLQ